MENDSKRRDVPIEQAFMKITATFDQRIARLMKSEEKRISLAVSDRKRKRVARRKELEASGEKIPKYLLEDDEKHLKSIFDIPRYITDAYEKSYALSVVLDINDIRTNVQAYCEFLARLKESDHPILYQESERHYQPTIEAARCLLTLRQSKTSA